VDLTGWQAKFGHDVFGPIGDIGETREVIGDIPLPAKDAAGRDRDLSPGLGVDDEKSTWANDDVVDLSAAARSRPSTVVKKCVASRCQRGEASCDLPLGTRGDHPSLGGLSRLRGKALVFTGLRL
jgi:hypothetical protein